MILTQRSRRLGRFTAGGEWAWTFPSALKQVMGQCIILRAEHHMATDKIEYFAISEHFREVPLGALIPEYLWTYSDHDGLQAHEVTR